jgi:hypothetical protein
MRLQNHWARAFKVTLVCMGFSPQRTPTSHAQAVALSQPSSSFMENVRVLLVPSLDTTVASPVTGRIRVFQP